MMTLPVATKDFKSSLDLMLANRKRDLTQNVNAIVLVLEKFPPGPLRGGNLVNRIIVGAPVKVVTPTATEVYNYSDRHAQIVYEVLQHAMLDADLLKILDLATIEARIQGAGYIKGFLEMTLEKTQLNGESETRRIQAGVSPDSSGLLESPSEDLHRGSGEVRGVELLGERA